MKLKKLTQEQHESLIKMYYHLHNYRDLLHNLSRHMDAMVPKNGNNLHTKADDLEKVMSNVRFLSDSTQKLYIE